MRTSVLELPAFSCSSFNTPPPNPAKDVTLHFKTKTSIISEFQAVFLSTEKSWGLMTRSRSDTLTFFLGRRTAVMSHDCCYVRETDSGSVSGGTDGQFHAGAALSVLSVLVPY